MQIHEGAAHTGVLPYKCQYCTKSFARKGLLANHVASRHSSHLTASAGSGGPLDPRSALNLSGAVASAASAAGPGGMTSSSELLHGTDNNAESFFIVEEVDGEDSMIQF